MSQPQSSRPAARKGRFLTNVTWNAAGFLVGVAAGIWYTPYLVHTLGVAAYGLVPLTVTLIEYMSLATLGLNAGVGRGLTLAVEREQYDEAQRIFNASFWGSVVLAGGLAVAGFGISCFAEHVIRVPAGMEVAARWLMAGVVVGFNLDLLATPFGTATYCLNRYDIRNALKIVQRLLQIGLVLLLFWLRGPSLYIMAGAIAFAAVFNLLRSVVVQRRLMPFLRVSRRLFDWRVTWDLLKFGGWMVVNQLGAILFLAIDLAVVNRMLGPQASGQYALAVQWSTLLRSFAGVVAGVFGPTIVYYYARNDIRGIEAYGRRAVKLVGLLVALPIGLICGLAQPILAVWLHKPEYAALGPLMSLLTGHLCINLAVLPLFNTQVAAGKVRLPAMVTCTMGAANLGLAILLCGPAGMGMYGVALAGCVLMTAKNALFTPLYAAHVLKVPWWTFGREVLTTAMATGVIAGACYVLTLTVNLASWGGLIAVGSLGGICYLAGVWRLLLTESEREMCRERLPRLQKWMGRRRAEAPAPCVETRECDPLG